MGKRRAEKTPGRSRGGSGDGGRKKKPQRSVKEDDFFDGASSDEENAARDDVAEEENDGDDLEETVHEKKVRLAKAYIDKLKAKAAEEEEDQGDEEIGEDEREGRRDSVVADLLRQEQLEESGKVQRKLASRLLLPEAPSEGNFLIRKHRLSVTALALTEDEKWGFSGSKDGLLLQWDVETGKCFRYERPRSEKTEAGKKSSSRVLALAVDSSGRYLASGGPDRSLHLWDVRTQAHIQAFPGHRGAITSLAFRQGTTQLFSGSSDRTLKLWSAEDRSYMDTLFGHQSELVSVDCLRQERVLSAGRDRTLRLWKVPEETQLVFRGYTASIESCCFVANGEFLSGADDGSVALWSALRKKPVYIAKNAHQEHRNGETSCGAIEAWVGAVATCRGSDLAASGAGDGKIQLWSVEDGNKSLKPLHTLPVKGFVNALAFARSGRFLLAGVGQEPRLGRWARNSEAKNGVLVHKLELSSSSS